MGIGSHAKAGDPKQGATPRSRRIALMRPPRTAGRLARFAGYVVHVSKNLSTSNQIETYEKFPRFVNGI